MAGVPGGGGSSWNPADSQTGKFNPSAEQGKLGNQAPEALGEEGGLTETLQGTPIVGDVLKLLFGSNKDGGVPEEFANSLATQDALRSLLLGQSAGIANALPINSLIPNTNILNTQMGLQGGGNILGQMAGIGGLQGFGQGLQSAVTGSQEGFTGDVGQLVGNLTGQFEQALRPTADRAFQTAEADIFESAARSGTTRSSTTTDQISRMGTDINNNLMSQVGGVGASLTNILAPLQSQQRQAATMALLGLPGQSSAMINQPGQQNFQNLLQGLQLAQGGLQASQQPPYLAPQNGLVGDLLGFAGGAVSKG